MVYAKLGESKDEEEKRTYKNRYKIERKEPKLAITTTKMTTFERLYVELEGKGGDNKLYRLTKAREEDRDLDQVIRTRTAKYWWRMQSLDGDDNHTFINS